MMAKKMSSGGDTGRLDDELVHGRGELALVIEPAVRPQETLSAESGGRAPQRTAIEPVDHALKAVWPWSGDADLGQVDGEDDGAGERRVVLGDGYHEAVRGEHETRDRPVRLGVVSGQRR